MISSFYVLSEVGKNKFKEMLPYNQIFRIARC